MLIPKSKYPAQVSGTDTNYPHGKAQNSLIKGDGNGTPLEEAWVNDLWGFQQAVMVDAGLTPTGTPDDAVNSQVLIGIKFLMIRAIRNLKPDTHAIPLQFSLNANDRWGYSNSGAHQPSSGLLRQEALDADNYIVVPFTVKDKLRTLTSVTVRLAGIAAHSALPSTMPRISVHLNHGLQLGSTVVDSSADVTSYEQSHDLTVSFDQDVDVDDQFSIHIQGESGTNSVVGLTVSKITATLGLQ